MIRQIPVTLPQSFEDALGYPGGFRWVAFFWEPCGDEAMYDDGFSSADCNWWGFLAFTRHPQVVPWLSPYDLGSSDSEARHWLLCDTESREVYVGEKVLVRDFLSSEVKKYVPEQPQVEYSLEGITELLSSMEEIQQVPAPSMAEIQEKMQRSQAAIDEMVAELGG